MAGPIVTVEQGQLRGKTGTDLNGGTFYSFQGIRYGKAPVGDLRFKAPVPAETWTGIRDATEEGSESISRHMLSFKPVGSEDCLSLNVYTPQLPNTNSNVPKAVMVWIHGGGFSTGSNKCEFFGPEFLVKEDIVLVSINYRLGILGFLHAEDTSLEVPGNAGLKDMVLALKWVQKNISQFGGDPKNVTIFGESAGSVACHYLLLSPMAKGLFHRAILQSGSILNPWGFTNRNALVLDIAKVLGHESKDEKDALEFLRSVSADKFIEALEQLKEPMFVDEDRPICPIIEKPNPEAFLTDSPLNLMLSGNYNKVPMIIGYTSREGMFMEVFQKMLNVEKCVYRFPDFEKVIFKGYNVPKGTETSLNLAKKIEEFYYGHSKSYEDDADPYYKLSSDLYWIRGIQITIKSLLQTLNDPIYFYRFSTESALNMFKKIGHITAPGACHGDDVAYLFKNMMTPVIDPKSLEEISVHRITKLWTNFAKTGNPNPTVKDPLIDIEWSKVTADVFNCLEIGEKLSITKNPDRDRMEFWDNVSASLNSEL